MGEQESQTAFRILMELRKAGISGELYHEPAKFDKQFKYAERKNIRFAVFIGSQEIEAQIAEVKDLQTGLKEKIPFGELAAQLAGR